LNRSSPVSRRNGYKNNPYKSGGSDSSVPMGGTGYDIPQAFRDDDIPGYNPVRRRNPTENRSRAGCCSWMVKFGILMTFVVVSGYSLVSYHERKMMKSQLLEQDSTMRELEIDLSMKFDSDVKKLRNENDVLQRKLTDQKGLQNQNDQLKEENKQIHQLKSENKQLSQLKEANKGLQTRVRDGKDQITTLKFDNGLYAEYKTKTEQNIQLMSEHALLEKFGPGPHRVEIQARFDSHKGFDDVGYITIELAPIEDMPHAVYWFLEQVSRKLYDGCSFYSDPGHVIQAGPIANFLSGENIPKHQRFKDAGFDTILFQEYSTKFPHQKYTLGYSGRPGGPDFYINMRDNSEAHGPGGQTHKHGFMEADTCFAKVIGGFDIVDRMHELPKEEGRAVLVDNVAITRMTITH